MTNEIGILANYEPLTLGPNADLTERAKRSFTEFLEVQDTTAISSPKTMRARWHRRPLVVAAMAVALLAAGGIAIGVIGDGVVYVEPATPITETAGLTLVVQESNIGPCLEVRTADGGMAGGCGADLAEPLSISVGSIDETTFASGWAPPGSAKIEMSFDDGEAVTVTTFELVEGYKVLFFVVSPVPSQGAEPSLPTKAAAYDHQGNTLAKVAYTDVNDPAPLHDD